MMMMFSPAMHKFKEHSLAGPGLCESGFYSTYGVHIHMYTYIETAMYVLYLRRKVNPFGFISTYMSLRPEFYLVTHTTCERSLMRDGYRAYMHTVQTMYVCIQCT
jgi:hypothetical protein